MGGSGLLPAAPAASRASSLVAPQANPTPRGTFIAKLVRALAERFELDAAERELAALLLFGRSFGAIARRLRVDIRELQRRCAALFAATHTDGKTQLFETGLRLSLARELSGYMLHRM